MYSRRADMARVMRSAESGVASAFRCMSTILATLMRLSKQGECCRSCLPDAVGFFQV